MTNPAIAIFLLLPLALPAPCPIPLPPHGGSVDKCTLTHQFEASLTLPIATYKQQSWFRIWGWVARTSVDKCTHQPHIHFYLLWSAQPPYQLAVPTRLEDMWMTVNIIIRVIIARLAWEWKLNTTGMCGSTQLECGALECAANFFQCNTCTINRHECKFASCWIKTAYVRNDRHLRSSFSFMWGLLMIRLAPIMSTLFLLKLVSMHMDQQVCTPG